MYIKDRLLSISNYYNCQTDCLIAGILTQGMAMSFRNMNIARVCFTFAR